MQDAIGIGLLLGMALLFRLCLHSTIGLAIHRHAFPFSLFAFWVLLMIAGLWLLAVGQTSRRWLRVPGSSGSAQRNEHLSAAKQGWDSRW